jgi:hypothetical protein
MSRFIYTNEDIKGILIRKKDAPVTLEPDKVMPTLEQALEDVVIEWEN